MDHIEYRSVSVSLILIKPTQKKKYQTFCKLYLLYKNSLLDILDSNLKMVQSIPETKTLI